MKDKPVILIDRSANPYLYPEEPILLHSNGNISCGGKVFKNTPRTRHFRQQYKFIADYLGRKKLPLNLTNFWEKSLGDIVAEMQSKKAKSISLKKLLDIYANENQLAPIRDSVIKRLAKLEYRRWWKKYKHLYKSDPKVAQEMREEFKTKDKIANDVVNSRR